MDELNQLREANPDVALILNTAEASARLYREALLAMGVLPSSSVEIGNSAEVTVLLDGGTDT